MADSKLTSKDQFSVGCSDNQESTSDDCGGFINFSNIKCKEHTRKCSSFYCKECEEFICSLCITKAHRGHDAVVEEEYNTEMNELLKFKKETDIKLRKLSFSKVSPITSAEVRDKTEQQQKPEITVIKQFATYSTPIYGLRTSSTHIVMLKDYFYGNLNYMDQKRDFRYMQQVQKCKCLMVFDIAVNSDNNILLSVEGETVLRVINLNSGEMLDSNYNVSPLITKGIHVTREQNVIIGCVTPKARSTGRRQQVVIVMDEEGNRVNQYDFDDNTKEALFTEPCRISSTSNGNICVVDLDQSLVGRIVVLQQAGNIKQVYAGHQGDRPFKPTDILTTPADNIVVTDCNNHTLHILSCDGVFITYIKTEDLEIIAPNCLAYSGSGTFYIGCSTRFDSVQAKIFQVQYSGF